MVDIDKLDDRFGIEGELGFCEIDGDLIAMTIYNKFADVEICLYGAHITRYMPHGSFDVLWMSPDSFFEVGRPIRGGIPLCFPWFGPHPSDTSKPAHGFARLMYWDVVETTSLESGETRVKLQLVSNEETKAYWPFDFKAVLEVLVGRTLEVQLSITNTGSQDFDYSAALHSYFGVSGIENINIQGLQGARYYNGFDTSLNTQETELLEIHQEENRRYIDTSSDCVIEDPVFNQAIRISKKGSNVTVVWNPWEETSSKMEDLPDDGYEAFVCVEAVNAYNDIVQLRPGEEHTTATTIGFDYRMSEMGLGKSNGGFKVI
ncbi:MAG TPA: D-hexose-6-phosphate mutarotase [Prolixibacteraceae bacterium]|nr:D-hexose-6-phosphate mutarotase [Prolixibacteraceae bacterium]HPS14128.1 D-hexose-6-phosphate mutarotase [Prolixibacteraceae bacterium]